jgi:hypothetical protein
MTLLLSEKDVLIRGVEAGLYNLINWLERRRDDELYTNAAGETELKREEVDKIIDGLKQWAKALTL